MRTLVALLALLLGAIATYVAAGFSTPPAITIASPEKFVGLETPFEASVSAPTSVSVRVEFEQNGTRTPLTPSTPGAPGTPGAAAEPAAGAEVPPAASAQTIAAVISRETIPALATGPARVIVTAERPVLYGLRTITAEAVRDVVVRLERPRLSVISTHHYVNQGGSEVVVYRVSPADVASGVLVGEVEYPGHPATGVAIDGVTIRDPAVRVAFFALLHDQPADTPMRLFARDEAGNTGRADFDYRVFPKTFKQSRIEVTDGLLERVVPGILAGTTEIRPSGSPIEQFIAINSDLRKRNADRIAAFAGETAPEMLWRGAAFHAYANNSVESAFADRRTYVYQGREVDRQVHLGFDLASFQRTPIVAAAAGRVLFADELGIYGNCVIVDHGMGLQTLYAHLSSMDVQPGAMVARDQTLGRSGVTGMAGGDHLHFTVLVNGRMVNPVEWWDPHWIEDRILRKLRAAGAQ